MATTIQSNDSARNDIIKNQKLLRGVHDESQRFSLDNISFSENMATDYLRFNAYSLRDVVIRKLAATPEFSGQIYPGSNLSLLVDLVAYVYQTLVYQINHAAAESMFSDTQYYENIVRLAKMLGYNASFRRRRCFVFRTPRCIRTGECCHFQEFQSTDIFIRIVPMW